jgi:hypothetical protein
MGALNISTDMTGSIKYKWPVSGIAIAIAAEDICPRKRISIVTPIPMCVDMFCARINNHKTHSDREIG